MLTYNEFLECTTEEERTNFILQAISEHELSRDFRTGIAAGKFYRHQDPDMEMIEKVYYDFQGLAHKDTFSPNHKLCANFYYIFISQMVQYLLGNGVSFDDPTVKERLGNDFDYKLQTLLTWAANDKVSYGLVTPNGIEPLNFACDSHKEPCFIELRDEYDGTIKAGIRYWRLAANKPLIVTLFEIEGMTEYREIKSDDDEKSGNIRLEIVKEKTPYTLNMVSNDVQGVYLSKGSNYSELPIVPLRFINDQSSLVGNRATLTAYNLAISNMVNDVSEFNLLYWVLKNAEGMDAYDDAQFLTNLLRTHVLHLQDGVEAEPHEIAPKFDSVETALKVLKEQLISDFMAVDWERMSGGNVTTVEIEAAYTNLKLKSSDVERCVGEFIRGVLKVLGLDPNTPFHFKPDVTINKAEEVQIILSTQNYFDEETITKLLCETFGIIDEFEAIQAKKAAESMARFGGSYGTANSAESGENTVIDESLTDTEQIIDNAEEQKGASLNGAQTQSLLTVVSQYASGTLTENQAVNIISTAIGVSKDKAREILRGE